VRPFCFSLLPGLDDLKGSFGAPQPCPLAQIAADLVEETQRKGRRRRAGVQLHLVGGAQDDFDVLGWSPDSIGSYPTWLLNAISVTRLRVEKVVRE